MILLWYFIYRDSPSESDQVTIKEKRRIDHGKVIDFSKKHSAIPYKQIYADMKFWAIVIAAIANMTSIQTLILFAPTYFRKTLGYAIIATGFIAAAPYFIQYTVKMGAGILSDRIPRLDETQKVRIFNSIAFFGQAFFLIILALIPANDWPEFGAFLFFAAVAILGFNAGGFFKSVTLFGRQYAYFINVHIQVWMIGIIYVFNLPKICRYIRYYPK